MQVSDGMSRVAGILDVHDLHVWNISTGIPVLTAHVHIGEDADPNQVRFRLNCACWAARERWILWGALGDFSQVRFGALLLTTLVAAGLCFKQLPTATSTCCQTLPL